MTLLTVREVHFSSHGVLAGPLARRSFILGLVGLVLLSDGRHQWVIRVGVRQQGADGEEDLRDGESGTPLILQNVEADATVRIDVRVVDSGCEVALRGLERVIRGEVDVQEVNTAGVG